MGKSISRFKSPFRNFNIEDRAHKVISRDKPVPAPRHQANVEEYEKILKNHPEIVEASLEKHDTLNKHLKNVFVTSQDPEPTIHSQQSSSRPLPLDRTVVQQFELGFKEMDKVQIGKASLRDIMKFIGMYQNNPKVNTAEKIAEIYNIDEDKVKNILKYVRVFEIYTPDDPDTKTKAHFAGPSIPKTIYTKMQRPQLPSGKKSNDNGDNT